MKNKRIDYICYLCILRPSWEGVEECVYQFVTSTPLRIVVRGPAESLCMHTLPALNPLSSSNIMACPPS